MVDFYLVVDVSQTQTRRLPKRVNKKRSLHHLVGDDVIMVTLTRFILKNSESSLLWNHLYLKRNTLGCLLTQMFVLALLRWTQRLHMRRT